jgi:hypothetical protein
MYNTTLPTPNQIVRIFTTLGTYDVVKFITTSDDDYFFDNMKDTIWDKCEVLSWCEI